MRAAPSLSLFCLALLLLMASPSPELHASGKMTRTPILVDAQCRPIEPGQRVWNIYITGRYEGMTSAPGGPVQHHIMPLHGDLLRVRQDHCEHPDKARFTRDGVCDGLPRWKWSGVVKPGIIYSVEGDEGGQIATVHVPRKDAPDWEPPQSTCPAPPPAPIDEKTHLEGSPMTFTLAVPREHIFLNGAPERPYVQLNLESLAPKLKHITHIWPTGYSEVDWSPAEAFGDGPTVDFEVTISRVRNRRDDSDWDGRHNAPICAMWELERLEVRHPKTSIVWNIEGQDLIWKRKGTCPR